MFNQERIKNLFIFLGNSQILLATHMVDDNQNNYHDDYCEGNGVIEDVVLEEGLEIICHMVKINQLQYILILFEYSQNSNMDQRPDHPHQAAVHLIKALKCCKECYDVSQADILQIRQLQYRKQLLAQQLSSMNYKADSIYNLKDEIKQLQVLILQLRNQNQQAQRIGIGEIDRMSSDRARFQNEQRESIMVQLTAERNLTHQLNLELQSLLERIKYLNRINNELIYNFCSP